MENVQQPPAQPTTQPTPPPAPSTPPVVNSDATTNTQQVPHSSSHLGKIIAISLLGVNIILALYIVVVLTT